MRVLAPPHRIRVARRGAPVTLPVPAPVERARLDLAPEVIEELLLAVGDREDMVGTDARARLRRARAVLERELVRQ